MREIFALLAASAVLGGCATKPLTLDCAEFRTTYAREVPLSRAVEEIQSDNERQLIAGQNLDRDIMLDALVDMLDSSMVTQPQRGLGKQETILALSGGGQWGAFGARYLKSLDENETTRLPQFSLITGVSTGALQALFVGASQSPGAPRAEILEELADRYRIKNESEIVNRRGYVGALFKGSVAELGPLRRRIETALCTGSSETLDCPIIDYLSADGAPIILLGFVEAASGQMMAVNISRIARDAAAGRAAGDRTAMKSAQQCITAGALASVAMPFYYQQVQIRSRPEAGAALQTLTYYDGGVRQSVFLDTMIEALAALSARKNVQGQTSPADMAIYVLRNGPTVARDEPGINDPAGAIASAERGYSLIVNQSEVAAIESIRLRQPVSDMRVATADGYDREFTDPRKPTPKLTCTKKDKSAMFEPQFMDCLQALGRSKAATKQGETTTGGWILLTKP